MSDPIPAPAGHGKVCYVVHTAESDVAPHFLNGRKGIWVRADEFSFKAQLADENELRHLLDRRKLIRERRVRILERARKRFDTYIARTHTDHGRKTGRVGPHFELSVVPRFPARPLCEQEKLSPVVAQSWGSLRLPFSKGSPVSQHESVIILQPTNGFSMFEANIWGMMFYGKKVSDYHPVAATFDLPGTPQAPTFGVHLYGFVGTTLSYLRHANTVLQMIGYSGPIYIHARLEFLREAPWLYKEPFGGRISERKMELQLDDEVEFALSTNSDDLRDRSDGVALDILRYVFFSVDWSDLVATKSQQEEVLRMGYGYNGWKEPQTWQV